MHAPMTGRNTKTQIKHGMAYNVELTQCRTKPLHNNISYSTMQYKIVHKM